MMVYVVSCLNVMDCIETLAPLRHAPEELLRIQYGMQEVRCA